MRFMRILQVIALAVLASPAFAQSVANDGYARDASTVVLKNPFGLCWRSGQWSEGKAIDECDPEVAPKPAKAEAARPAAPLIEARVGEAPGPQPAAPDAGGTRAWRS